MFLSPNHNSEKQKDNNDDGMFFAVLDAKCSSGKQIFRDKDHHFVISLKLTNRLV